MSFQYQWAGARLQNLYSLRCWKCLDIPQQQLKARILPPDPVPIANPRPEPVTPTGISRQETQYISAEDNSTIIGTEDGTTQISADDQPSTSDN